MQNKINLNGIWKCRDYDNYHGFWNQCIDDTTYDELYFDAVVPGDIHNDMMKLGRIENPIYGTNAQKCRWVEEQVYIYKTEFEIIESIANKHLWLTFEGLDYDAQVYLNSELIGSHNNAFIPARFNVTGKIKQGTNKIAVKIDSGLYCVAEKSSIEYNHNYLDHSLHKRAWLRKPQYQFQWDWNPRLINVGIYKDVYLEYSDDIRIESIVPQISLSENYDNALINYNIEIENRDLENVSAKVCISSAGNNINVESDIVIPPGMSTHNLSFNIADPKLWNPRPHGEPYLYNISLNITTAKGTVISRENKIGIRDIKIDQSKHPEEGRYFTLVVNGNPIFAKGGNWVPPDLIYANIDKKRIQELIKLALDANFNTLRVWGGGLYASHDFLELCDENGIIVWHDFGFACSKYPGDNPDFLNNVRKEITYIVKELAYHPSLLVWCGNNELERGWEYDMYKSYPDYALYHQEIPLILKDNDTNRPYWPSSPYSPDYLHPNDKTAGDQHPWEMSIGSSDADFWVYRKDISRFPSEGGVLGASSINTLKEFLPENEQYFNSNTWEFHDNTMNFNHRKQLCTTMLQRWMGMNPNEMSLEDYAFYSGLIHAEALTEYINNFRRRMFDSSAAIFWMYNDSWPVTHGWTIIDYYNRRKIAYHPVKRAFRDIHIIPCIEDDEVLIVGVNDTLNKWNGKVKYGFVIFDGKYESIIEKEVKLTANSRTIIDKIPLKTWDKLSFDKSAVFAQLFENNKQVSYNRIFNEAFKNLDFAFAEVKIKKEPGYLKLISDKFVWGVCIDPTGEKQIDDDTFDMLPGVEYKIYTETENLEGIKSGSKARFIEI